MRKLNVDKMRHARERSRAASEARNRQESWDGMTPEHRAIHESPTFLICGTCISAIGKRLSLSMREMREAGEARAAKRAVPGPQEPPQPAPGRKFA